MALIADTHAVVWFLEGDQRLSATAKERLSDRAAEIAFLYARKRIGVGVPDVLSYLTSARNCRTYPLDEVVVEHLPETLNIHDAIIVATALVFAEAAGEPVAVVTKDAQITTSGLVNVAW